RSEYGGTSFRDQENAWTGLSRWPLSGAVKVEPDPCSRRDRTQRSDSKPGRAWRTYARYLPSGEYAGCASAAGFVSVTLVSVPPSTGTVQMSVFVDHAASFSGSAVKATSLPSGEKA